MDNFIGNNINAIRIHKGLSQEQMAQAAGVSQTTISAWECGSSTPRKSNAMKMVESLSGIDFDDIMSEENGFAVKVLENRLLSKLPKGAIIPPPARPAFMPLLGRVHAGEAQEPDVIEEKISVPYEIWEYHKNAYLLEVEGSCMNRVYPEGCYVAIDRDRKPQNGSIAVVSIDGADYVMRRMYRGANTMILSPDSWDEGYEDIVIDENDGHTVELVGTVVWFQPSKVME